MTALPTLYSFRRCPYAMRARLALLASETAFVLREVVLREKPAEMLEASPKGTVPVLVTTDGEVIDQSLDIMIWALERNDSENWLDGHDEALITRNDGAFKHHLDRYKYPERHGSIAEDHRAAGLEILSDLDARLAIHANLCGEARSITDMAIMPFVRQFAATDPAWFAAQALPHLRRWLDAHLASPLFERAMARFAPWKPGDDPVIIA